MGNSNRRAVSIVSVVIAVIVILLPFALTGCVWVRELDWPGVHVRAEAGLWPFPPPRLFRFHQVRIDMTRQPPPFALRMPDGKLIPSDQLTEQALAAYAVDYDHLAVHGVERPLPAAATRKRIAFLAGDVILDFVDGRATCVDIAAWGALRRVAAGDGGAPGLAPLKSERPFHLPLNDRELTEIFGKPTRVHQYAFFT
jgi:hypothetical protein